MKIGDVRRSGLRVIIPLGIDYYTAPVSVQTSQGPYNSQHPSLLLPLGHFVSRLTFSLGKTYTKTPNLDLYIILRNSTKLKHRWRVRRELNNTGTLLEGSGTLPNRTWRCSARGTGIRMWMKRKFKGGAPPSSFLFLFFSPLPYLSSEIQPQQNLTFSITWQILQ